jgi:hypothetical protein
LKKISYKSLNFLEKYTKHSIIFRNIKNLKAFIVSSFYVSDVWTRIKNLIESNLSDSYKNLHLIDAQSPFFLLAAKIG